MSNDDKYRPNVGIVIVNQNNQVFWARRIHEISWQFPQGGIDADETPEEAMYRELTEETGLLPCHIKILGRTADWVRYDIPPQFNQYRYRGYRGQNQVWFMVLLEAQESYIRLSANEHPEFDAWCWREYWAPVEEIVDFKKEVYLNVLQELVQYLNGVEPYADWSTRRLQVKK